MDDLIARAKKYARSAGRTGLGHYNAAERNEWYNRWIGRLSAALSAIVGTSIFAQWIQDYPLPFGLAAVVAAGLSAVQGTSRLSERAESHRAAGAEYGRVRRRVDMLRLRVQGQDVCRDEGLAELDRIGEELAELAKKSSALPDSIYYPAIQQFDKDHSEYFESSPSHAGGVVIRREDASIRYLVVTAKGAPGEWVLPKGHINPGESAEQAARREVLQETGVDTAVRDALDLVEFSAPRGRVRAQFFLMEAVREGPPREGRDRNWCSYDEATELLRFREAQRLICQAHLLLRNETASIGQS